MDYENAITLGTQTLRDIVQGLKNISLSDGNWTEGTNDHTIKNTSNITYMIDGVIKLKSATDNITATTCVVQAVGKRCRYLISMNAAGTVTVTKGAEVTSLTTGGVATLAWDAVEKKLMDSTSLLGSFKAGDLINVSGFTQNENNGTFTVEVVDPNGGWIQVRENCMISEVEGDTVTVLRESALPNCPAKQAASGIMIVTTGTTTFTVGTQDITADIGTGSISFVDIGLMPTDFAG